MGNELVDLSDEIRMISSYEDEKKIMDEQIDTYIDKLDSYKWMFTKYSKGNYVFISVEGIK